MALECPSKLYYTGKSNYVDKKLDDVFLESLAKGGFQVGELAKLYFPGGSNIDDLDHDIALDKTKALLQNENIIIYEAAFLYNNLFIRVDILKKSGNNIHLIEVKAKSYRSGEQFLNAKGEIRSEWEPYLFDVAFQRYVVEKSNPNYNVKGSLMLADKDKRTSIDGLNQMFFLYKDSDRTKVHVTYSGTPQDLGDQILSTINVDDISNQIYNQEYSIADQKLSFEGLINLYSYHYVNDQFLRHRLGSKCASCEYTADNVHLQQGLKSGYHECWKNLANFTVTDFSKPHILKIWDYRKKDEYIADKKYFQMQLDRVDLEPKSTKKVKPAKGLSRVDRQELQITKSKNSDLSQYFDLEIREEMKTWNFPLHFIDFETSAVAIPFNKERKPYEQIAFQYSHHIVYSDGSIEHKGQWINNTPGYFPNYEFVRNLKKELENDEGTIFRYAAHENSILNAIYNQLKESNENDKDELCTWIKTITKSTSSSIEKWEGHRNMVDMRDLVLKYYYHPQTEGSNSIKAVLPAILNESIYLKEKYSTPMYGTEIPSLNFSNQQWIQKTEDGRVINPYDLLPLVFDGKSGEDLDNLITDEEMGIHDGGTAMIAYAQMQFTQMSSEERQRLSSALLRYCELDTFAMVLIYEAWKDWCKL